MSPSGATWLKSSKATSVQGVTSSREAKLLMQADPFAHGDDGPVRQHYACDCRYRRRRAVGTARQIEKLFLSRELADLAEAGAVGDISLRFFDKDGRPVKTSLDDRVIGLPLEELERVDRVIALAGGGKKTDAIAGALRISVIDPLVIDNFTAHRLRGLDITIYLMCSVVQRCRRTSPSSPVETRYT
jgi:hypothetical protein